MRKLIVSLCCLPMVLSLNAGLGFAQQQTSNEQGADANQRISSGENLAPEMQSEAFKVDRDGAYAQINQAWTLAKSGNWKDAKAAYEKAWQLDPYLAIAQTGVAVCTAKMGRYSEATKLFKSAKTQFPDSPWPHLGLATVWSDLHKTAEAKIEIGQALTLDPDNLEAQRQNAAILLEQNNWLEASNAYKILLSKSTASAEDHVGLGLALSGAKDSDNAIAEFKQAVALDPANASAHAALGLVLASSGQQTEAMDQAKKAMDLDPKQRLAQAVFHRLNDQVK